MTLKWLPFKTSNCIAVFQLLGGHLFSLIFPGLLTTNTLLYVLASTYMFGSLALKSKHSPDPCLEITPSLFGSLPSLLLLVVLATRFSFIRSVNSKP